MMGKSLAMGGSGAADFQDDLELVFLGPKLLATSCLSRLRNSGILALPPPPGISR